MNEHLQPVFDIFLPALQDGGVPYWVYGGLSIAAHQGRFVRTAGNKDVDAFVRETDFERAKVLLEEACRTCHFPPPRDKAQGWRRKFEIKNSTGTALLTLVTVQVKDDVVIHLVGNKSQEYSG